MPPWQVGENPLMTCLKIPVCSLVCRGCPVVAFAVTPGPPDLAHGCWAGPQRTRGELASARMHSGRALAATGRHRLGCEYSYPITWAAGHILRPRCPWPLKKRQVTAACSPQAENLLGRKRAALRPAPALPARVRRPPGVQGLLAGEM